MIDPELLEMHESTVQIAPPQAQRGIDGKVSYDPDVDYQAHVENTAKLIRNAQGEQAWSTGRAFLIDVYPITEHHRLTLPNGKTPLIVAVEDTYDTTGPYQTVVHY